MKRLLLVIAAISGLSADVTFESSKYAIDKLIGKEKVVSMLVIGSGPAGCAASTYGARAGIDVLMFEGPLPGGQLTETGFVENWPGIKRAKGPDIMENQRKQAEGAGAKISTETVVFVDTSKWPFRVKTAEGTTINALTIIVATGSEPCKLGIPGEKQYWGQGVSACAVCDAPFYEGRDVVVVGGGDSAIEQVIQLASYAKNVVLLVRRGEVRASQAMQSKLPYMENVVVEYSKELKRVCGDENGVCAVDIFDKKCGTTERRKIDGVFLAIGHSPRTQIFEGKLALDEDGCIKVEGRSQRTSVPGIFAAGDVADGVYRQAGVAAGEGSKAERDAERFLQSLGLTPTVLKTLRLGTRKIDGLQFYK